MQCLHQLPAGQLVVGGAIALSLIWGLDYLIKVDLGFSIFYLFPIAALAWYVSPRAGYLASAISAVLWFIAESARTAPEALIFFLVWNTAVRLAFWLLTVELLAELQTSYRKEQQLASTDFLTGLLNRRAFIETLNQEILRSQRHQLVFTLAYLDVDGFKQVNDRLGHAAGDRLLEAIAQTLRQTLRETDHSSRLGGDEFAVLMPQTSQTQASSVLGRMFQDLSTVKAEEVSIGFSVGAVTFCSAPESADQAIAVADRLMYTVKAKGKNQIFQEVYAQPSSQTVPE